MKSERKAEEQFINELAELRQRIAELEQSETKYRGIFENAVEGIFQITPDGRILAANPAAANMLGYSSPEELIAVVTDIRQLYVEPGLWDEFIHEVQTKSVMTGFEVQTRCRDDSLIWISANMRALQDASGRIVGFVGMGVDITERKRVEEALRESEMSYRTLFNRAGDAILILDAEGENAGNIIAANKAAAELHGYTVDELLTLKITDLDDPEAAKETPERIRRSLSGEWIKEEIAHRKKDGTVIPVEISGGMIEFGNHRYILSFDRDISERKRAEETLKNYAAKLEEANHLKDLFTDIIRHDLLNPLGVMRTATEHLLFVETMDERMCNTLRMIKRNTDKLIDMIKSVSMYAMLESAEKLDRVKLDLNKIFEVVANNFKPQLEEKNMKLEYISKGECCVTANPMIDAVFSNLLSNAIKYSPAGRSIEVNIMEEEEHCKIHVKDWGYGIKEEDKAKLFTRFQRMDKKGVKGTGLGLAIVKRIVDLHGGRVWIEDNPEGGSVFCVEIPKAKERLIKYGISL